MNLVITVRRRSPLRRKWREWWYELLHGCNQLVFFHHEGTNQMGSDHEGIFTNRHARRDSDEIELVVFRRARSPRISIREELQLAEQVGAFAKTLGYERTGIRIRKDG